MIIVYESDQVLWNEFPPELKAKIWSYIYEDRRLALTLAWKPYYCLGDQALKILYYSHLVDSVESLKKRLDEKRLDHRAFIRVGHACWACGHHFTHYDHPLDHLFWIVNCYRCYFRRRFIGTDLARGNIFDLLIGL
jgi:hypothetical protein